jgi:hypothetical protein
MHFASGRVRPGVVAGATRMRTLQVLLLAGAILVLAGLLTVSITTLRRHADRARQTQVLAANLTAATQQVSRIEWEATALRAVSRELRKEHEQAHRRTDRLLSAYLRVARDPGDRRLLTTPMHRYLSGSTRNSACSPLGGPRRAHEWTRNRSIRASRRCNANSA